MGPCLVGTLALALAVPAAPPLRAAGALEQVAEAATVERHFTITLTSSAGR